MEITNEKMKERSEKSKEGGGKMVGREKRKKGRKEGKKKEGRERGKRNLCQFVILTFSVIHM